MSRFMITTVYDEVLHKIETMSVGDIDFQALNDVHILKTSMLFKDSRKGQLKITVINDKAIKSEREKLETTQLTPEQQRVFNRQTIINPPDPRAYGAYRPPAPGRYGLRRGKARKRAGGAVPSRQRAEIPASAHGRGNTAGKRSPRLLHIRALPAGGATELSMRTRPAKPGKDSHRLDYFFAAHII